MSKKFYFVVVGLLFLTIFFVTSYTNLINNFPHTFTSPDSASNYVIVKEYGSTGNMYLEKDYTYLDEENMLHQRGLLTWNDKVVPFNFLGMFLFHGTFYSVLQDNVKVINLFLLIVLIGASKILLESLTNRRIKTVYMLFGVIGSLPLLYLFNFPYYNIVPAITFFFLSVAFAFKFNMTGEEKYFYLSFLFALMSIWFRYTYVLFLGLFYIINYFLNMKAYHKRFIKNVLVVSLLSFFVFLVPLFVMNNVLYDDPFIFGYTLHNQIFFDDRVAQEGESETLNLLASIFYPSYNFDLGLLFNNLYKQFFLLTPFYILLGALLVFEGSRKYSIDMKLWPYLILIIYIIIYMGMSITWGHDTDYKKLNSSMLRYWLIIHVLLMLMMVLSLLNLESKMFKFFIVAVMVVYSFSVLFMLNSEDDSLVDRVERLDRYEDYGGIIEGLTDEGSIIYDSAYDKILFSHRDIATWWSGTNSKFDKDDTLNSMNRLLDNNYTVYYHVSTPLNREYLEDMKENDLNITFVKLAKNLYEVEN